MEKMIEEHIATIEIKKELCDKPCDLCKMYGKECMPERMAKKLAKQGYRKQEWISVDERLPQPFEELLVYCESSEELYISCLLKSTNDFIAVEKVTHWMPLPQPPKMKGAE